MTWREWLYDLSEEEFLNSAYFKNTVGLIQHKGIRELLQRNGALMQIALHPFMKKFENYFISLGDSDSGIEFLDSQRASIERCIEESDMLLTDITSVSWDFLYLNKPIIFNMFDQKEYLEKRGTYLDLDKDLYGYKADTIEEVYRSLVKIIEGGMNTNEWYPIAPKYIDFFDQQNCERLAQRVLGVA